MKLPRSPRAANSGIDWGDADIGAAGLFGLTALGLAGSLALMRRRRGTTAHGQAAPTV